DVGSFGGEVTSAQTSAPSLETLVAAGVIDHGDAYFARFCASSAELPHRGLLELVVAAVSRHLAEGHPCVPLTMLAGHSFRTQEGLLLASLPSEEVIREALKNATCVAPNDSEKRQTTPLVLDEGGRLYVARFFEHERRLACALAALLRQQGT